MKNIFSLLLMAVSCYVHALSGGQVTVKHATSPFYILDSNTPCSAGPRAAYVCIKVINNSTTDTLYNVYVMLDSIAGNSGFKLLGPTDSIENIGRVLPRDSGSAYFYMRYPCTHNLTANYYFKVGDMVSGTVAFNTSLYTRSSISANAGGLLVSQNVAYLDALGTVITDTVTYEFGNVQKDDEINIQPNGDTLFKAGYVRLLNSQVITSDIPNAVPVGAKDRLYFVSPTNYGGSGNRVKVVYYYLNHLYNDSTTFRPYAGLTSGSTNFKYSGNYASAGAGTSGLKTTTAAKKFTTSLTASCGICNANDTVTYTFKIINNASSYIQIDQVKSVLPAGYSYIDFASGSTISKANSSFFPGNGSTGTLYFKGYIPQNIFPFESYLISAGDSLVLKIKVKVKSTTNNNLDVHTANPIIGPLNLDLVSVTTCAGCSALPVKLMYFEAKETDLGRLLLWATASEINNDYFELKRSTDNGNTFVSVGFVKGKGNSQEVNSYSFTDDKQVASTKLYYQLTQYDYDGGEESYYTRLSLQRNNKPVKVFPNPFSDKIQISGNQINAVKIVDATGRIILSSSDDRECCNDIVTSEWPKGYYLVYICGKNGAVTVKKLVKSF